MKAFLKDLKLGLKIILWLCVGQTVLIFISGDDFSFENLKTYYFYNFYYGLPISLSMGFFFNGLEPFFPWGQGPKKRIWVGIAGSVVLTMLILFILNWILWVGIEGKAFDILFSKRHRKFYVMAIIITTVITSILHAIEFFKIAQENKIAVERIKKEKLATELSALKAHVDPHFLFNSFNTLSGLIDEDTDKAQNFLQNVTSIYRYILENRNEDTSTVKDEIEFAKKYLALQQERFENSIFLKIELADDDFKKSLPTLSLQLLLENAVKHNAFDEKEPLHIHIKKEEEMLVVRNNTKKRKNLSSGSGMGLENIKDRYELMGIKTFEFNKQENNFEVKLPLIS